MIFNNTQILTVGRSGHGKTLALLSLANHEETSPVHVLSLDRRIALLQDRKNLTYDLFNTREGWIKVDNKLSSYLDAGDNLPFKTLMLCGITSLLDFLVVDVGNILAISKSDDDKQYGQRIGNLYIPGMRDYLYVSEAMRQIFYNGLFQIPCNIIVEANIANSYDSKGNVDGDRILASDKVAEKIPTFFDEIWAFQKKLSVVETNQPNWKVWFRGSLARTSFSQLEKEGGFDITNKDFYEEISRRVK